MHNFAGQDIQKGHFIAQIARTNRGIVRRVGVVLDLTQVEEDLHLRVGWYDPEVPEVNASESVVSVENAVLIDPNTLPNTTRIPLEYVLFRGRAAL